MLFTLIKGTFIPLPRTWKEGTIVAETPSIPDGDTVRFRPDNEALLKGIPSQGEALKINPTNRTVSLRYEGIDAPERGSKEPFASAATAKNLECLRLVDIYACSRGYILTRQLGPHGRPIAFVFAGDEVRGNHADGASVSLDVEWMRESVNFRLINAGAVYPLFYQTLDEKLRAAISIEASVVREAGRGFWPWDNTTDGVSWSSRWSLPDIYPIFPKLWRRLQTYVQANGSREESCTLATFEDYLVERCDKLEIVGEPPGPKRLSDIVDVRVGNGNKSTTIRMCYLPEELIFIPSHAAPRR